MRSTWLLLLAACAPTEGTVMASGPVTSLDASELGLNADAEVSISALFSREGTAVGSDPVLFPGALLDLSIRAGDVQWTAASGDLGLFGESSLLLSSEALQGEEWEGWSIEASLFGPADLELDEPPETWTAISGMLTVRGGVREQWIQFETE